MRYERHRSSRLQTAVWLATAAAAAVALWAAGLGEVSWAPFFFVAVASGRRARCLDVFNRSARS